MNPNPARITEPMWKLWTDCPIQGAKLSGIYADKRGYHNTVVANKSKWPGNYSIVLPLDLVNINRDKARAIDLTMTDSDMVKWTKRMKDSALNPADNRLAAVREFYGTLDNATVYGLIKDDLDGPWKKSSSDSTHLWHGHTSIFTKFVNDWDMLAPLHSVWAGESLLDWKTQMNSLFISKGDSGEEVKYWQGVHNEVRETVTPPSPQLVADGNYGDSTAAAFADFVHKQGGQTAYTGQSVPAWCGIRYHKALATVSVPIVVAPSFNSNEIKELVNAWLVENLPSNLSLSGDFTGKVSL
jgi:hypothetical protein